MSHLDYRRQGPASVRVCVVTSSDTRGEAETRAARTCARPRPQLAMSWSTTAW